VRSISLARLIQSVEKALIVTMLFACVFAHSAENDLREPDPVPQVDLNSDYSQAKQLLTQRKWEEAAIILRGIFKKNPEFTSSAMDLARALAYSGRREEALTVLAHASTHLSGARRKAVINRSRVLSRIFLTQQASQIYLEGLTLLQTQKYRPARERFEKSLELEPDNVEILMRVGQCLVLEGDNDSAAERLRLARRLNPYEAEVKLWLGHAMHLRGELTEAVEELKVAYAGLEGSERAPIWYAQALVSADQRKNALVLLVQDLKIQPFHLLALVTLAQLRAQASRGDEKEELAEARKDLQLAESRLALSPTPDGAHFEGELGIELPPPVGGLKPEIARILTQLDGRILNTARK
jgi:Flp pilus assembly protein TadD